MIYPLPETDTEHQRWCYWDGAFIDKELEKIKEICSTFDLEDSTITNRNTLSKEERSALRNNSVVFLPVDKETNFIYERIATIISKINSQFYQFDISGMGELIQYSEYHVGEHYNAWHTDNVEGMPTYDLPRKLSLTMQLSKPEEYEGGDLQIRIGQEPDIMKKQFGHMVLFPSYTLHRITPVTKGVRKSLVVWVGGPKFK